LVNSVVVTRHCIFYRVTLCYCGIYLCRVSVCVSVCHTPVLYQNG